MSTHKITIPARLSLVNNKWWAAFELPRHFVGIDLRTGRISAQTEYLPYEVSLDTPSLWEFSCYA